MIRMEKDWGKRWLRLASIPLLSEFQHSSPQFRCHKKWLVEGHKTTHIKQVIVFSCAPIKRSVCVERQNVHGGEGEEGSGRGMGEVVLYQPTEVVLAPSWFYVYPDFFTLTTFFTINLEKQTFVSPPSFLGEVFSFAPWFFSEIWTVYIQLLTCAYLIYFFENNTVRAYNFIYIYIYIHIYQTALFIVRQNRLVG